MYGVARWLPFAVDAVTYAVSGCCSADCVPTCPPRPASSAARCSRDLRDGISFVARHPLFRTLTGWACLTNLTINALFTVAILRMVEGGVDPWQIGLVEAAAAAAGILGAVLAPWVIERVPTGWLTIAVAWSPLPLVIPMANWAHRPWSPAPWLVVLLNPIGNAGMSSYRLTVTPDALVGRVQSASQFVSMASLPLAPLLGAGLLAALGGSRALLVAGVLCGLVALLPTLARSVRVRAAPRGVADRPRSRRPPRCRWRPDVR